MLALVLRHREALQGRPKVCKGGKSATNVYSYDYLFARRAIVATFELSAQHLDAFMTDHWLSNKLNVVVLYLKLSPRKTGDRIPGDSYGAFFVKNGKIPNVSNKSKTSKLFQKFQTFQKIKKIQTFQKFPP